MLFSSVRSILRADYLPQPEEEVDGDDEDVDESLLNTSQVNTTKVVPGTN